MKTLSKFLFLLTATLLVFVAKVNSQVKTNYNGHLVLGDETYTPLILGSEWSIEFWENGLNFWKPWPAPYDGNYKLYISNKGNVSIGVKSSDTYKLQVNGTVGATGYMTTSDARLKKNVNNLTDCLDKIVNLNGYSYNKKNINQKYSNEEIQRMLDVGKISKENVGKLVEQKESYSGIEYGFIAQEVREIFPELVVEDNEGYLSLDYQGLLPVIVEALKEQKNKINSQQEEIDNLLNIIFE